MKAECSDITEKNESIFFYGYVKTIPLFMPDYALRGKTEKGIPSDEYENFVNAHLDASMQQRNTFQQNLELNLESHGKH